MHDKTLTFAISHPNSHIAIVDTERYETIAHFSVAQFQLSVFIKRTSHSERKLYLANGTVIYFIAAPSYERLRGLKLDRIEAADEARIVMPENFLETRLKPDIAPDEGIIYRGLPNEHYRVSWLTVPEGSSQHEVVSKEKLQELITLQMDGKIYGLTLPEPVKRSLADG